MSDSYADSFAGGRINSDTSSLDGATLCESDESEMHNDAHNTLYIVQMPTSVLLGTLPRLDTAINVLQNPDQSIVGHLKYFVTADSDDHPGVVYDDAAMQEPLSALMAGGSIEDILYQTLHDAADDCSGWVSEMDLSCTEPVRETDTRPMSVVMVVTKPDGVPLAFAYRSSYGDGQGATYYVGLLENGGDPTGESTIDLVRDFIASHRWADCSKKHSFHIVTPSDYPPILNLVRKSVSDKLLSSMEQVREEPYAWETRTNLQRQNARIQRGRTMTESDVARRIDSFDAETFAQMAGGALVQGDLDDVRRVFEGLTV